MKTKDVYYLYRERKVIGQYSFEQITVMSSKNEDQLTDQILAVGSKSFREVSSVIPAHEKGASIDIFKNAKRGKNIALVICALAWVDGITITHYSNMKGINSRIAGYAIILYFFINPRSKF